jgi:hypothetical protein
MIDQLHTYSFSCSNDNSIMSIEISRELDYTPKCLKCNRTMHLRYSISNDGEVWMNSGIMHE